VVGGRGGRGEGVPLTRFRDIAHAGDIPHVSVRGVHLWACGGGEGEGGGWEGVPLTCIRDIAHCSHLPHSTCHEG
jgi:hypothetical protein